MGLILSANIKKTKRMRLYYLFAIILSKKGITLVRVGAHINKFKSDSPSWRNPSNEKIRLSTSMNMIHSVL